MKLNFAGVESSGLVAMKPGTYDATCIDAIETIAKSTGNPMVVLTFHIDQEPYIGRKVFLYLVLLPQTMWKVKTTLEAILGDSLPSEEGVDVELEELRTRQCRVKTALREYEGQQRESIQAVLPLGTPTTPGASATTTSKGPSLFS